MRAQKLRKPGTTGDTNPDPNQLEFLCCSRWESTSPRTDTASTGWQQSAKQQGYYYMAGIQGLKLDLKTSGPESGK